MVAVGCVFLIVLPIAGVVFGLWMAGTHGAIWGAAGAFLVALAVCGIATYALIKAARRR